MSKIKKKISTLKEEKSREWDRKNKKKKGEKENKRKMIIEKVYFYLMSGIFRFRIRLCIQDSRVYCPHIYKTVCLCVGLALHLRPN